MPSLEDTVPGDEKAVLGPSKIERKGKDGTTIVFYSFPEGEQLKQIKHGYEVLEEGKLEPTFIPYKLSPASDEVRKNVESAHRQIEGIADIKFYDLKHLSTTQRAELSANGIAIPLLDDTPIYQIDDEKVHFSGTSKFPYEKDYRGIGLTSSDVVSPAASGELNATIMHEIMHTLGFMHSSRNDGDGGKPVLGELDDHYGNTVMSYQRYDHCGTPFIPKTYRALDIAALQAIYGPSKNPTPNLQENLAQEERERNATAPSDLATVVAENKADESALYQLYVFNALNRDDIVGSDNNPSDNNPIEEQEIKDFLTQVEIRKQQLTPDQRRRIEKMGVNSGDLIFTEVKEEGDQDTNVTKMRIAIGQMEGTKAEELKSVILSPEGMKYLAEHSVRQGNSYLIELTPNLPQAPVPGIPSQATAPEDKAPSLPPAPAIEPKTTPVSGGKPEDKFFGLDLSKHGAIGFDSQSSVADAAPHQNKAPLPTAIVNTGPDKGAVLG